MSQPITRYDKLRERYPMLDSVFELAADQLYEGASVQMALNHATRWVERNTAPEHREVLCSKLRTFLELVETRRVRERETEQAV